MSEARERYENERQIHITVVSKTAPAYLGDPHRPALPALPNLLRCHKVELCLNVVEVGVPVRVEIYR